MKDTPLKLGETVAVNPVDGRHVLNVNTQANFKEGDVATVDTRLIRLIEDGDLVLTSKADSQKAKAPAKKTSAETK